MLKTSGTEFQKEGIKSQNGKSNIHSPKPPRSFNMHTATQIHHSRKLLDLSDPCPPPRPHNSINCSFRKYYHRQLMSQSANISVTVSSSPQILESLSSTYDLSSFKEFSALLWSKDWLTVLEKHSDGQQIWTKVSIALKICFLSENHQGIRRAWLHR